jgi:hypothetical protein
MTILMSDRHTVGFIRYGAPATTATTVGRALIRGSNSFEDSYRDRANFALEWAVWEPALIAQHHREWF